MKTILRLMLVVSLVAPAAHGARRRAAVAAPAAEELAIVFVPVAGESLMGDLLDIGHVVRGKVTRTIGIRVERRGRANKGVAVLRAWVEAPDGRMTVRVDGIPLGGAPRLIDAQTPLGATVAHRIEMEVAPTVAEGAVVSPIRWEVTTGE